MSLYFILLIFTGIVPLSLSFDKRMQFYKQWKYVLPSIFIVAAVFIAFDIYFTKQGFWGFNSRYLSGINVLNLPLEECLFFVFVPYASIFLHETFREYFPKMILRKRISYSIIYMLIIAGVLLAVLNIDKSYTLYIFTKFTFVLILAILSDSKAIRSFLLTFFVILIPFLIVNGILTGSFINEEVVWYNNAENLGIRIFTIPVEDFVYAFTLIYLNLLLVEQLKKRY